MTSRSTGCGASASTSARTFSGYLVLVFADTAHKFDVFSGLPDIQLVRPEVHPDHIRCAWRRPLPKLEKQIQPNANVTICQ